MVRAVSLAMLLALSLGQVPSASAAGLDGPLVPVQFPGPPGPPGGPGWPGWPGPMPGPQWAQHHQYCKGLARHFRRLKWRIRHSPPWERQQYAPELMQTRVRLQRDCWGR